MTSPDFTSPLDLVLSRLTGVGRAGSGHSAFCPAHPNTDTPALSVGVGNNGSVVFHCHAQQCDVQSIVRALGLELSDLFPGGRHPSRALSATPPRPSREVRYFDYRDAGGVLRYRVKREDFTNGHKRCRPERPDGSGGFVVGRGEVPPLLYRLPETIEAIAEERVVYLVEGEPKADVLAAWGLAATTSGSATSWRDEFAPTLEGAHVVILPDNDEPGRKYARTVHDSLQGIAASVRIVELPDLPPKGDVVDWARVGGTRAALEALVADAAPAASGDISPAAGALRRIPLLTIADLEQLADPSPLIGGVLFVRTLACLIAPYASFKSFVALDWAMHVAAGMDWNGHRVTPGGVVYVYAEGSAGIKRRVRAWLAANELPDVGNLHFVPISVPLNDPAAAAALTAAIGELPRAPALIVVDTLQRNLRGSDSDGEDMNDFVHACDRLREASGATILVVHHMGWEGTRSRGSTVLPASADTEITLARDGDFVTLKCTKQKDAPPFPDLTLEAFEVAGSLALRPVGLRRSKLSLNEERCLRAVFESAGTEATGWKAIHERTGLSRSSVFNALKHLVTECYLRQDAKTYAITDAGRLKLGPQSTHSPAPVHGTLESESTSPGGIIPLDSGRLPLADHDGAAA